MNKYKVSVKRPLSSKTGKTKMVFQKWIYCYAPNKRIVKRDIDKLNNESTHLYKLVGVIK